MAITANPSTESPLRTMRVYTGCRSSMSHNSEVSQGDEMEFKSRIFATSRGSTIDAIGDGKYLVCNPAYCFMVHGLRQAHEAVQRQEKPAL